MLPVSLSHGFPPKTSISWRTAVSHESSSSPLSKTRSIFIIDLFSSMGLKLNLDRAFRASALATGGGARGSITLDICNTQCLPGITSLAKATESFRNWTIFSGSLLIIPSDEY